MLCLYEAPDEEAVRLAEGEARATFDRAWTCAQLRIGSHGQQAPTAEYVVVERLFPEPVTQEFFANALREKGWCLDLYRAEYVEGYLGADGLRAVCVFRAPTPNRFGLPIIRQAFHTPRSGQQVLTNPASGRI